MSRNKKGQSARVYNQLANLVTETFADMIGEIIIQIDGEYVFYNRYHVTRDVNGVTVYRRQDAERFEFSTMKHAIIWITLDKHSLYRERNHMYRLDKSLGGAVSERIIHDRLRKKLSIESDQFAIYTTKYHSDRTKEKRFVAEIDKYYKLATRCHLQGIKNETNRTSKK